MKNRFTSFPSSDSTIYINGDKYCLCMPNEQVDTYQIFLGFSNKDLSILPKEQIINEVKKISELVNSLNKSGICVLPIISPVELEEAALENDDRKFNEIMVQKIQPITAEIYQILSSQNKKVNQTINMIKQTESDRKFIGWMSMRLGNNYIREVDFNQLKEEQMRLDSQPSQADIDDSRSNQGKEPSLRSEDNRPFTSGIAPIDRSYENVPTMERKNKLVRVRKMEPPKNVSPGFSSMKFIIITLLASLVIGIGVGWFLIK